MYLVQKCRKYINSIENTSAQFFLQENAERNRDYQIDVDVCTMNALFAVKYFSRSIKSHVQLTSSYYISIRHLVANLLFVYK